LVKEVKAKKESEMLDKEHSKREAIFVKSSGELVRNLKARFERRRQKPIDWVLEKLVIIILLIST
jgi:hypothetical protein|tara:strand:+ start:136 stop:330 length:195 start_codon:yes stop_codon:yes gene_type:complete